MKIAMFEGYGKWCQKRKITAAPSAAQRETRKVFANCAKVCRKESGPYGKCMTACMAPGTKRGFQRAMSFRPQPRRRAAPARRSSRGGRR